MNDIIAERCGFINNTDVGDEQLDGFIEYYSYGDYFLTTHQNGHTVYITQKDSHFNDSTIVTNIGDLKEWFEEHTDYRVGRTGTAGIEQPLPNETQRQAIQSQQRAMRMSAVVHESMQPFHTINLCNETTFKKEPEFDGEYNLAYDTSLIGSLKRRYKNINRKKFIVKAMEILIVFVASLLIFYTLFLY